MLPFLEEFYDDPSSPIWHKRAQAYALQFLQTETWLTRREHRIAGWLLRKNKYLAWTYFQLTGDPDFHTTWLRLHIDMWEKEARGEEQRELGHSLLTARVRDETGLTDRGKSCLLLMLEDEIVAADYRHLKLCKHRRRWVEETVMMGAARAGVHDEDRLFESDC